MKVLLAYLCHYQDRNDYYMSLMPVGAVSIAACLEQEGYDVTLANFTKTGYRKALQRIQKLKPDVIGLSLFTHNRVATLRLAVEIKKLLPDTILILGGPHATFLAEEIIKRQPEVDYIIQGEAERATVDLLENIKNGKNPDNKIIPSKITKNIDDLPSPGEFSGRLIDIKPQEQFSFIITSRGCAHCCIFCSSPTFWRGQVRCRSPRNILQEILNLYKKYGIIYFSIRDDNFTLNKQQVMEFCRLLKDSGIYIMWNCQARVDAIDEEMLIAMKRAGLEHIQFGVESGSARILRDYDKLTSIEDVEKCAAITRKVGVYLSIYLMAGMDRETHDDINKTKTIIKKILPHDGIVSPVALYPGTMLYEQTRKNKTVGDAVWFERPESGIYLRNDKQVKKWIAELLIELQRIRGKALYRESDFKKHREVAGDDCWVTDILEGDSFYEKRRYAEAERSYNRVIEKYPLNPWGYLRMVNLKKVLNRKEIAEQLYMHVKSIVPKFMQDS